MPSVPLLFVAFSEKNLFLRESPKEVVIWVKIRTVQGPVLSTCKTIRKSVSDDTQVESVMQKVQNSICCV
jgi:hypothetical protein